MWNNGLASIIILLLLTSIQKCSSEDAKEFRILKALVEALKFLSTLESSSVFLFTTESDLDSLNRILLSLKFTLVHVLQAGHSMKLPNNSIMIFLVDKKNQLTSVMEKQEKATLQAIKSILIVFLENETEPSSLSSIFKSLSTLATHNVNVLSMNKAIITMAAIFPFQESGCWKSNPVITNIYNETLSQWNNKEIFPNKLRNFYNCPLRVSTLEYPPAVMKNPGNEASDANLYGSDIEVIKGLSSSLNFVVNFSYIAEPYNFGEIFINGSSTGAISHVVQGDADIAIGFYFLNYEKLAYLSNSYP